MLHHCIRWLFLALVLAPLAAQGQIIPDRVRLLTSGKYAELEKLGESEIKGDANAKSARLMPLCAAYSKLKRYNKLFPCLDRLEANIKRGDTAANDLEEMRRNSPLMSGLASFGAALMGGDDVLKGTVVPYLHLMRADAYTELRDYDKAIAAANEAIKAIPTRWNEERAYRIGALAALGLAHGFAGNRDQALNAAQTLSEVSTSYPFTLLSGEKWLGVAKIYVALGDFKQAHESLK